MQLSVLLAPLLGAALAVAAPVEFQAAPVAVAALRSFAVNSSSTASLPPSQDPFYRFPDDLDTFGNGTVIRSRPVNTSFAAVANSSYQLLYRTTSAMGNASAALTTVFSPRAPVSPPQIMLLMAPIDSASPDCQVGYALESGSGSNATTLLPSIAADIVASLSKGWYVSVPDHEGPEAAFISGVTSAFAGIDGLRAALNSSDLIANVTGYKAVIHGYSGGADAASWATQFLPSYGEGLHVVGASFGGTPVRLLPTLELLSNGSASFLAVSALAGLGNAYKELDAWYNSSLTTAGQEAFALARSQCAEGLASLNNVDVFGLFTNGSAALDDSIPQKYLALEQLGQPLNNTLAPVNTTGLLPVPVFMYHSETDGTVSYAPVPAYVEDQCARGANLTFANTTGLAHAQTYIAYEGDVYQFLTAAFDGSLNSTGECSRQNGVVNAFGSPGYIREIGLAAWTLLASAGANVRRRSYGW